jgi:hypothetical protein
MNFSQKEKTLIEGRKETPRTENNYGNGTVKILTILGRVYVSWPEVL